MARCPGLGHPVRGGAAARGSTATGRRQREEPTDDGEDGRDPGEKQEDAVGEVGEVVVASAKLEAKRRGRGGRRRQCGRGPALGPAAPAWQVGPCQPRPGPLSGAGRAEEVHSRPRTRGGRRPASGRRREVLA